MNHIGSAQLETKRLILRKISINDADEMYNNWASNPEVAKYVTWSVHKNVEETKELLAKWEKGYENKNYYKWLITLKDGDIAIGTIDVVRQNDELEMVEIGYCISQEYWGSGITTEAFKKVIQFLFEEVGYNRIQASHAVMNPASGRVMQKCGLKFEGVIRDGNRLNSGKLCDVAMYSILKKEYKKEGEL